jgi:hypothetical protein
MPVPCHDPATAPADSVRPRPKQGAKNSGDDDRQAGIEADAATTTTAIAVLRARLRHQGTLQHPAVSCELRKLEEQLAAQLEQAERTRGRHRAPASSPPVQPGPGPGDDTDEPGLNEDQNLQSCVA